MKTFQSWVLIAQWEYEELAAYGVLTVVEALEVLLSGPWRTFFRVWTTLEILVLLLVGGGLVGTEWLMSRRTSSQAPRCPANKRARK